jgi:hypothetical protein
MSNIAILSKPLRIDQIDFRVQSINKGGYATILAYKDARADMDRLDEAVGPLGWKREHSRDNHNCTVSIFDAEHGHWVSKEDTGTESNAEAQKGLASDSFKRACFNWGIGRELYAYPSISIKLDANEFTVDNGKAKATWDLKIRQWKWHSVWLDNVLVYLAVKDTKPNPKLRWEWFGETPAMIEAGKELNNCLETDDYPGAAQIYEEFEVGERNVICRAPSKGGQLSTPNRDKLKGTAFREAQIEARG